MEGLELAIRAFDQQKYMNDIYGRIGAKEQAEKIKGLVMRQKNKVKERMILGAQL